MSDLYSTDGTWLTDDRLPGWKIATRPIDCGTAHGVAIWNGTRGDGCARMAVKVAETDEEKAINAALPSLAQWVRSRKPAAGA